MARVTLRLPDDLHRRLRIASERDGVSLNQLMVAALRDSLGRGPGAGTPDGPLGEQSRYIRRALGDLAIELDTSILPLGLRPSEELPDPDALRQRMPDLTPPLSATIIADRADLPHHDS